MNGSCAKRLPLWTLLLCGCALIAPVVGAGAVLQYDRGALATGQWWRAATGHLAHWSADHLFWDAATFAALGLLAELRSRTRFLLCAAGSAVVISAGLWFLRPDVELYRGLSGIDSALFALVAAGLLRDSVVTRRRLTAAVASAALAGLGLKLAWELSTGNALFVDGDGGFECLPLAHALGAAVGFPLGLCEPKGAAMNWDLNIFAAWAGILAGLIAGVAQGLFFHRDDWLGGYDSWPRRLMRLGHVSFFGIAFLNLAFAWTTKQTGWRPPWALPSVMLAAAQGLMPLVCYLAAWRQGLRRLFFLPVTCVLVGIVGLLAGRVLP